MAASNQQEFKVTFSDKDNDKAYDKSAYQLAPHIFIGDCDAASFVQIRHRSITAVVCCDVDLIGFCKEKSVEYFHFDPIESPQTDENVAKLFGFFTRHNASNVLMFCQSGSGKSIAVALAYMIWNEKSSLANAYRKLLSWKGNITHSRL